MKFEEVKADYIKLIKDYGIPYDMTGGFVDSEAMEKVILNPSKNNAMKYMLSVIGYGFQNDGFWTFTLDDEHKEYISVETDNYIKQCYEKYINQRERV